MRERERGREGSSGQQRTAALGTCCGTQNKLRNKLFVCAVHVFLFCVVLLYVVLLIILVYIYGIHMRHTYKAYICIYSCLKLDALAHFP